ncbi:hypothetical protein GCM10007147_10790 [Nocardiopsis kunsanensis]|uniref:Peptide chain release factor 1 n=2 Tax=Nocardiopsis kunsanensis TaxID=141693 RepID=A0A918XAL9_9ACTN|nr:hypothetical protein GCM10007147_10790 [Nocardiopsis kunsanensis]
MDPRADPKKEVGQGGGHTPCTHMDLGFLRPLYSTDAPVASVHLDTSRHSTDSDKEIELRWRHLRQHLTRLGTDQATLHALEEAVGQGPSRSYGTHGQSLFASQGQLLDTHTLAVPPQHDHATWMPVPDPLPLVVDRGRHIPYVLVALDRVNAKIVGYTDQPTQGPALQEHPTGQTMHNLDGPLGRSGPGQRRGLGGRGSAQHAAQQMWRENTAAFAERAREAVRAVDAKIILVGGDEEAITYLRQNLGPRQLSIPIRIIAGGRGGQAAQERLHQATEQALAEHILDEHTQALNDYQQKLAHDQAVEGTEQATHMLTEARVQTLLLTAQRQNENHLYASLTQPVPVAQDPADLGQVDHDVFTAPASALMLRSAAASGASFTELLEQDTALAGSDHGALLRFAGNNH